MNNITDFQVITPQQLVKRSRKKFPLGAENIIKTGKMPEKNMVLNFEVKLKNFPCSLGKCCSWQFWKEYFQKGTT